MVFRSLFPSWRGFAEEGTWGDGEGHSWTSTCNRLYLRPCKGEELKEAKTLIKELGNLWAV
ncbi:hypothetical protein MJO28_002841 [Puccinia striiformis f. sp. tritici]|uniref:Uncharacterized protein n=1 Tax=Puccinia striiformis f. sp. tritici TaxID=168172 RepID=A0ACC0ER11_9BASI|nr:hypothetical protein MJO28_002841 [Puccinia striiformis f. sp. tritici]